MSWILVNTTPFQSVADTNLIVDTTSQAITILLPANPVAGESLTVGDANDWSDNQLTIASDTTIEGSNNDLILNVKSSQYQFIYNGSTWKYFNISRPQTKISELNQATTVDVDDDDLMLIVDNTSIVSTSKYATFGTLKGKFNEDTYTTIDSIVTDLNALTTGDILNVYQLNSEPASYYLNYENFDNTPSIPTKTSDLTNDGSNPTDGLTYMINFDGFTTDDLDEGSINKYFNQTNFDNFFNESFAENYRLYSGDFSETQLQDSFDDVIATPNVTYQATDTIQLNQLSDVSKFYEGQILTIFGGSIDTEVLTIPTLSSVTVNGFSTITNQSILTYRIAQFDLTNGKISAHTAPSSTATVEFDSFNDENNVTISFTRSSASNGILVYRDKDGGGFKLIEVLGQNELGNSTSGTYTDYGTFNYTEWSLKNSTTGTYDTSTGTIHFPLISSGATQEGWVDVEVLSIDTNSGEITLTESYNFNNTVTLVQNDTSFLQQAIDERDGNGINSLTINDRVYNVSTLRLPDGFSLSGKGRKSIIKKMPWSTEDNLNIVYASGLNNSNITLSNFDIDGNQQNQWLRSTINDYNNDAIKVVGDGIDINKVHIRNVAGGGIYSPNSSKININSSRVENSGMNDLYAFSPLTANEGSDIIVTNNTFKNFTSNIDLSTTLTGIFSNNVVDNCGSGVLIFGSKNFISSPNLIKGPAGEYISGPDILNSEYDSVNINIEYGSSFTSAEFVYQENGDLFDLTANRAELSYQVQKLRKVDNVEEEYGEVLISSLSPLANVFDVNVEPENGEFKFSISQTNVDTLLTTYSHSTLHDIDSNHVGLIYKAQLTEYVPSGTIQAQTANNTSYEVNVQEYSNLYEGSKVRMLNHGGTPNLDNLVGTVININDSLASGPNPSLILTIEYDQSISAEGSGGNITVENTFLLAKGKVQ